MIRLVKMSLNIMVIHPTSYARVLYFKYRNGVAFLCERTGHLVNGRVVENEVVVGSGTT